jgi:hypothetical protein
MRARSSLLLVAWLALLSLLGCADANPPLSPEPSDSSAASTAAVAPSAAAPPGLDDTVQIYVSRRGTWEPGLLRDIPREGEFIHADRLMRVHGGAIQWVKTVDVAKLADADAAHDPKAEHRFPEERDVVYVTGANGYHAQLGHVPPGHKVAFQGRIYELVAGAAPGEMQIGYTGIVVNRVAQTFKRKTDTLIDLTLRYAESGREGVISGTPEHPFFVPARNDYVPMGKLEPGTVLRTDDGSTASVVASKTKHGDFEVFNLEVENAHNYFVSAKNKDGAAKGKDGVACGNGETLPGVLVHNQCAAPGTALSPIFRQFTQGNFRHNLTKLLGYAPKNAQAHHALPVKFESQFAKAGINIHDPRYGAWWDATAHSQASSAYNQAFEAFFRGSPNASATQILDFGRGLAQRYGLDVVF